MQDSSRSLSSISTHFPKVRIAERFYQSFKWDCISRLPGEKFRLPIAVVDSWIQNNVYRADH